MEITVRTGVLLGKLAITYRTNQSKNGTNKNIIKVCMISYTVELTRILTPL